VVGVLDVPLLQELEVDRADLEAVAASKQGGLLDSHVVDVGPVGRAQVLQDDGFDAVGQRRVAPRERRRVGDADVGVLAPPEDQSRAGTKTVPGAQLVALRMGDQNDVGLRARIGRPAARRDRSVVAFEAVDGLLGIGGDLES
jgi:hypothetical protein